MNEIHRNVVLPWELAQIGKAEIFEPDFFKTYICQVIQSIISKYVNYKREIL